MKLLPKHQSLRPLFFELLLLGSVIVLFFPEPMASSFRAQSLLTGLAVLLILTPWAHKHFCIQVKQSSAVKPFHFLYSLSLTFLLQIILNITFYSICRLVSTTLAIASPVKTLNLFQETTHVLLVDWGIFPWGAYALLACALGYKLYIHKYPVKMSTLILSISPAVSESLWALMVDISTKIAIVFSLAGTIALLLLACMSLLFRYTGISFAYGPRLDLLLLMLIVLQITKGDTLDNCLKQIRKNKIIGSSPARLISFVACVVLIFLGSMSILIGWLSPIYTPLISRMVTINFLNWPVIWMIFCGIWWLGWAPLVAGFLVTIWRGYRLRTLLIATLLLPFLMALGILKYPQWYLIGDHIPTLYYLLGAILSLIGIGWFFLRMPFIVYAFKGILPAHTRLYQRASLNPLKQFFQIFIAIILIYWISGIYIIGLTSIFLLPTIFNVFLVGIVIWRDVFKKSISAS